jgi:hypothetical protein
MDDGTAQDAMALAAGPDERTVADCIVREPYAEG